MRRQSVMVFGALCVSAVTSFANLVPISAVPTNLVQNNGSGYGNVLALLNAQNNSGHNTDGVEANCNIISGGNVTQSCSGPFAGTTLNDPGNINNAWSLADAGISDASHAAEQLRLIFNINQTGDSPAITLQQIGLALWDGDQLIWGTLSSRTDTYTTIEQGVGNAGFGYMLDSGQAASAQSALTSYMTLHNKKLRDILVTGAFQAGCPPTGTCANDGAESLYLSSYGPNVHVPDGGMSVILLGAALVGVETLRRKLSA